MGWLWLTEEFSDADPWGAEVGRGRSASEPGCRGLWQRSLLLS